MKCKIIVVALFFLILLFPNLTVIAQNQEEEELKNTARELYEQIMCPLCPGQTIGRSTNETSKQMRDMVLKKLRQGETKEEILKYFISRYGERIMAKPNKKGLNLMLWLLPFVFLALTAIVIYLLIRLWARKARVEEAPRFKEAESVKYKERVEKELKEFDDGF